MFVCAATRVKGPLVPARPTSSSVWFTSAAKPSEPVTHITTTRPQRGSARATSPYGVPVSGSASHSQLPVLTSLTSG